jgi:hypothetical protein
MDEMKTTYGPFARAKTIITALLALAVASAAQTVTFTNTAGRVYENVRVERIDPRGVIWFATNAQHGGLARFSDMSPETRARFGHDARLEALALGEDHERKITQQSRIVVVPKSAAPAVKPVVVVSTIESTGGPGWTANALFKAMGAEDSGARQAERFGSLNRDMQRRGSEWRIQAGVNGRR